MPYSTNEIVALRERRLVIGNSLRAILDSAKAEERSLTTEEQANIDKAHLDADGLRKQIETMEKADGLLQELDAPQQRKAAVLDDMAPEKADEAKAEMRKAGTGPRDTEHYRGVFRRYLEGEVDYSQAVSEALQQRDLQVDNFTKAGALVPDEEFVGELIKEIDDAVMLRGPGWARGFQVRQAKSLGAPKRTAKASTWVWGSELGTPSVDTTLAFGKRVLFPQDACGEIKVSRPWLRSALLSPEQIVREELARDAAEHLEISMLTGTGAGEPLGVLTASADGISTGRDVSTGNTTTEVTVEGLSEAKYNIKAPYWPRLKFLGSRTFHKQLYGMKDGVGRPLFVESLRVGEPDRVMGFPVFISEFVPSVFTAGLYVAILGDWTTGYWYADAYDMTIEALYELYARSNQVGFIGRLKNDGMPVLEECWSRIKLAP